MLLRVGTGRRASTQGLCELCLGSGQTEKLLQHFTDRKISPKRIAYQEYDLGVGVPRCGRKATNERAYRDNIRGQSIGSPNGKIGGAGIGYRIANVFHRPERGVELAASSGLDKFDCAPANTESVTAFGLRAKHVVGVNNISVGAQESNTVGKPIERVFQ